MKKTGTKVDRRKFLTGVAIAGAATAANGSATAATAATSPAAAPDKVPAVMRPSTAYAAAEAEIPKELKPVAGRPGSDFMVDVIKSLNIEYVCANPASSYRGLHESLINYGGNSMPEFIECTHEESSIAMAHGHFKATGKPLAVLCHGVVGLMHGTMAIYNAWCDHVPVIVMGGNDLDASKRPPGVPTTHSAQDINALVRDFTKWDDTPVSPQHFAQSFVRAYKLAMTPPYEPVMLAIDAEVQEAPMHDTAHLYIPKYVSTAPPQAEAGALREAAKLLVNAQNPVIVVDRAARTANGVKLLIELAELLQAPVFDQGGRMNFPNTHHLNQTARGRALVGQADLVLGMELTDFWNTVNAFVDNADNDGAGLQESRIKPGTKLISISSLELNQKSNYQNFQRFQSVDISMAGDAEASLPTLIEAVKAAITSDKKAAFEKRGETFKKAWAETRERNRQTAVLAWDASPISTARMCMELWAQIKDLDWSLVNATGNGDRYVSGWPSRLWKVDRHYRNLGGSGGAGQGYGLPASVGAALGNKPLGRFSVSIQGDGDFMYAPGVLWTAAHHQIPLLTVMHNNHGYHQEVMHVQRMTNRRNRVANNGKDFGPVGTKLQNPDIDYAKLASSMGLWSAGPITDPQELGPALKKAVEVVKAGEPALVDVHTQPR